MLTLALPDNAGAASAKTISRPSGDHVGLKPKSVNRRTLLLARSRTAMPMSSAPALYAIERPSGENAGVVAPAAAEPLVRLTGSPLPGVSRKRPQVPVALLT